MFSQQIRSSINFKANIAHKHFNRLSVQFFHIQFTVELFDPSQHLLEIVRFRSGDSICVGVGNRHWWRCWWLEQCFRQRIIGKFHFLWFGSVVDEISKIKFLQTGEKSETVLFELARKLKRKLHSTNRVAMNFLRFPFSFNCFYLATMQHRNNNNRKIFIPA